MHEVDGDGLLAYADAIGLPCGAIATAMWNRVKPAANIN